MTRAELQAARKALGLSQREMARAIGVTRESYYRMERELGSPDYPRIAPRTERTIEALLELHRRIPAR